MANIVLGMGTSHGPLLSTPPDMWSLRADSDRANPELFYQGQAYDFAALMEKRGRRFDDEASLLNREKSHAACQLSIDRLAQAWGAADPDVVVIFGNDQREIFTPKIRRRSRWCRVTVWSIAPSPNCVCNRWTRALRFRRAG